MPKTDVDKPVDRDTVIQTIDEPAEYLPGMKWDDLVSSSDEMVGFDLAKESLLDALVGVPFVITAATFRPPSDKGPRWVSVEALLAPADFMRKRRVDLDNLPFDPDDMIIFNDSGTGIYRQLAAYVSMRGYCTIPDTLPEGGKRDESRYDLPFTDWTILAGEVSRDTDGTPYAWRQPLGTRPLFAKRGIRISEYAMPGIGEAQTRYIG